MLLPQGGKEEAKDEEASERIEPKQLTPREALERIHAARVHSLHLSTKTSFQPHCREGWTVSYQG